MAEALRGAENREQAHELGIPTTKGVHDPDYMPFGFPFTDAPAEEIPLNTLQHIWRLLSEWRPRAWRLPFAAVHGGAVIGRQ